MTRDGIEREFKTMLADAAERERLLALIGGGLRVLNQRNLLFDTRAGALARAGLSLRLRHENALWVLTAKGERPTRQGGLPDHLSHRAEAEAIIHPNLALHLAAGTADPLPPLRHAQPAAIALTLAGAIEAAADGAPLVVVGEFRNTRTLIDASLPCGTPLAVALDQSEMPDGTTEHELELEIAPAAVAPAAAWLERLMRRADVPIRPASSKRQRFASALARRNGAAG
jgi:uncharacterized protein YjbK